MPKVQYRIVFGRLQHYFMLLSAMRHAHVGERIFSFFGLYFCSRGDIFYTQSARHRTVPTPTASASGGVCMKARAGILGPHGNHSAVYFVFC